MITRTRSNNFLFSNWFQLYNALFLLLFSCQAQENIPKINGLSLVAAREEITANNIRPMLKVHANAVALMPFGFMKELAHPQLVYNSPRQWWGEQEVGIRKTARLLHKNKIQVMLKPQIWVWRGEFTGNIKMNSEAHWKEFENSYQDFILYYAKIAQEEQIEIFCIGTELAGFVKLRPKFWKGLISKAKNIYKGKLTYAENWDKMEEFPFWRQLDFIGVDAYFPLHEAASPNLEQLKEAWKTPKSKLKNLSQTHKTPILFTEYGYRSVDYATRQPWDSSRESRALNQNLQARAIKAVLESFWRENWFAGGFLWKWHQEHASSGGINDDRFTPQNKPAEKTLATYYKKFKH